MYRCENWTIKKAEHWRWFQTVVLEKTLENPLDCKEIKPVNPKRKSTLNIHRKDWCWSWSSNTLATWCKELTHWKRPWSWERLRVGGEGAAGDEMVGWQHQLNGHEFEQTPRDSEWITGKPSVQQFMGLQTVRHDLATEQQSPFPGWKLCWITLASLSSVTFPAQGRTGS